MLVDSHAIYGEGGHDEIGTFDIKGTVTGNDFEFTKTYRGKHKISYHGHFENQYTMVGHWGYGAKEKEDKFKLELLSESYY